MSGVAMGGGVLLYFLLQYGFDLHSHVQSRHTAKRAFDRLMLGLSVAAERVTTRVYRAGMTGGVFALIATACLAGAFPFFSATGTRGDVAGTPIEPMALVAFALLCVASMGVVFAHRTRFVALLLLAVVGLTVTLVFVYYSAPDLALTQIAVEAVTILLLLLALYYLPQDAPPESAVDRALRDFFLGCLAGGGVGWLTWAMLTRPADSISSYFIANSIQQGGGANVVNVLLVDFRGYDTYGEITVIVIAALGVAAMLTGVKLPQRETDDAGRPWSPETSYLPLDLLVRLLLPLALLVSAYLFLRGHNAPGGGFVAGLVTAVALTLLYVGTGLAWTRARLKLSFRAVAAAGLLIAGLTGLTAMVGFDLPFLTSAHGHLTWPLIGDIPLASAMMFDLGVYLAVVGATLLVLTHLGDPDVMPAQGV
jgi:multicomponent K+:H+ antiporter subunit A